MTRGKPCVKMHVFTIHMASHVSTCMGFDLCINGEFTIGSWKERKGRERIEREEMRKRERRKKEKKGKGKEREKEEGGRWFLTQFISIPTVRTRWTKE